MAQDTSRYLERLLVSPLFPGMEQPHRPWTICANFGDIIGGAGPQVVDHRVRCGDDVVGVASGSVAGFYVSRGRPRLRHQSSPNNIGMSQQVLHMGFSASVAEDVLSYPTIAVLAAALGDGAIFV